LPEVVRHSDTMRVISDDALDDRPATERRTVAEQLATVMRTTGFGDHHSARPAFMDE
jgi:hypothetical protein